MKHCFRILLPLLVIAYTPIYAQNVGIGTQKPHQSGILDIESHDKGVLVPRMSSAEMGAIPQPAQGLLVFKQTTSSFWYFK